MLGDFYYCQSCKIQHDEGEKEVHSNQRQCLESAAVWYNVFVMWGNSDFIFDGIKGTSPEDALKNAWENWSDAWKIDIGVVMES